MIIKNYEINKIDLRKNKFILFYGQNEGFKNEAIKNLIGKKEEINVYDEKEVIDNETNFIENLKSKSLFEEKKIIIIKRATNKISNIIEKINDRDLDGIIIIINAGNLETKSKLRNIFEKNKEYICTAFYPDNDQTLVRIAFNFFKLNKIAISNLDTNFIIDKCNGDRETLLNELNKINLFLQGGKKLTKDNLTKLINLSEDYSIDELINNCLAKNEKKTIKILNENNLTNESCILITRIFLNKLKKIYNLSKEFRRNKDIDLTISSAQPKIFWKDKEIVKKQIIEWTPSNVKKLIYKVNDIELQLKKNINNSVNIIINFIIEQTTSKN